MEHIWYSEDELKKIGFKTLGHNVKIGKHVIFLHPESLECGNNVQLWDFTIIHKNVKIEDNCVIEPNCILGHPTKQQMMGKDHSRTDPKLANFLLPEETIIGKNSVIRSNSVIYNNVQINQNFSSGHNIIIRENTQIGKNCLIGSNSVFNGYTRVGDFTRINTMCAIPQSIIIGEGVFIAPLVAFSDNKNAVLGFGNEGPIIEDYVRLGVGTIVLPKLRISKGSMTGCGAVITKDTEEMSINYGNPASKHGTLSEDEFLEYKKSVQGWI